MKKKVIIVASICALFLLILMGVVVSAAVKGNGGEVVTQMSFTKEITVKDHVAQTEDTSYKIVIDKNGEYVFYGKWEADTAGLITGCKIVDEKGKEVFKSTAESCTMNSAPIYMEKGEYVLTLSYISDMKQWADFVGDDFYTNEDYLFAAEGTFTIPYEFRVEKDFNFVGTMIALGMLVGGALAILTVVVIKKGDGVKSEYDERQELIRGRGFKYGFFTILIANYIYYMFWMVESMTFLGPDIALVVTSLLGVCVSACYCIWNDGYFALNEKKECFIVIAIVGGIINMVLGIWAFVSGTAIYNGKLTFSSLNLFCGIMILIVGGVMLLKKIRKEDE